MLGYILLEDDFFLFYTRNALLLIINIIINSFSNYISSTDFMSEKHWFTKPLSRISANYFPGWYKV